MLSLQATHEALGRHRAIHDAGRWTDLPDLFAQDARYHDPFYGWMQGRETIRDFLKRSMAGLDDWTFPIPWELVGEGRAVTHWINRLPQTRPDGAHFEFGGLSAIRFGDDGLIEEQRDTYDRVEALQVILGAKTGIAGRAVAACWRPVSGGLLAMTHKAISTGS